MPTYDYQCDSCGHEFEIFQTITEGKKRKCPECGRLKLKRLFGTGAAIVFKGSGFYQTDYRSESYKKGVEAEKKAQESPSKSKDKSSGSEKTSGSEKASSSAAEKKATA